MLVWNQHSILHGCPLCRVLLCPDKHLSWRTQKAFSYLTLTRLAARPRQGSGTPHLGTGQLPVLTAWCFHLGSAAGKDSAMKTKCTLDSCELMGEAPAADRCQQLQEPNHQPLVREQPDIPSHWLPPGGSSSDGSGREGLEPSQLRRWQVTNSWGSSAKAQTENRVSEFFLIIQMKSGRTGQEISWSNLLPSCPYNTSEEKLQNILLNNFQGWRCFCRKLSAGKVFKVIQRVRDQECG